MKVIITNTFKKDFCNIFNSSKLIGFFVEKIKKSKLINLNTEYKKFKIEILNQEIRQNKGKIDKILKIKFRQTLNSYLGLIKNNNSYKLRKKILYNFVSPYFCNYFYISTNFTKIKSKYSISC